MMKVYVALPPVKSTALQRVHLALHWYVPRGIQFADVEKTAELVVLPVVGRRDKVQRTADLLRRQGKQYAIIQYCLRSTQKPLTQDWLPIWENAVLVWSYYDLPFLCGKDGAQSDFPFYCAPLGVNGSIFYDRGFDRLKFVIATSGPAMTSESVREAFHAAGRVNRMIFHLGPDMHHPNVIWASGIDDPTLATFYSQCEYVAGLRRTEGFELPVIEGLLCGARPICFDRHHYRKWFEPWAEFIPEGSREEVIDSLEALFREGSRPVTAQEQNEVRKCFDWSVITEGFWKEILANARGS